MSRFIGRLVIAGVAVVAIIIALGGIGGLIPALNLPFTTSSVDRSQPPLLREIESIGEYHAASGNFQVIVDVEKDTRFVPSFIKGERTVMVVAGSVDAGVNLHRLPQDAVAVNGPDEVRVTLPPVVLFPPRVDPERSAVAGRSRGLVDRVSSVFGDDPGAERELMALGGRKLASAAAASPELTERAKRTTRAMIAGLLRRAGYQEVTVLFREPAV
jgi:hypothetical protein